MGTRAYIDLTPGSGVGVRDEPLVPWSGLRMAVVRLDGAEIAVGGTGARDESVVAAGELLIAALRELVDGARARMARDNVEPADLPESALRALWGDR